MSELKIETVKILKKVSYNQALVDMLEQRALHPNKPLTLIEEELRK